MTILDKVILAVTVVVCSTASAQGPPEEGGSDFGAIGAFILFEVSGDLYGSAGFEERVDPLLVDPMGNDVSFVFDAFITGTGTHGLENLRVLKSGETAQFVLSGVKSGVGVGQYSLTATLSYMPAELYDPNEEFHAWIGIDSDYATVHVE